MVLLLSMLAVLAGLIANLQAAKFFAERSVLPRLDAEDRA